MNNNKKPDPLISHRIHDRCPVCGEKSYSSAGIHPQCAVRRADEKRLEIVKQQKQDEPVETATNQTLRWQKKCPKCQQMIHVRKKVCDCGYDFAKHANARSGETRFS